MSNTKRHPLQVSEDVMTLFQECHEKIRARSIGASVKETILTLRRQLEENNGSNPYTDASLWKRQLEHLERMRKENGFTSLKEAIAYLQGRIETAITPQTETPQDDSTHKEAPTDSRSIPATPRHTNVPFIH